MMNAEVRLITAEETIALRWPILRAGMERESAIFPGDDGPDTCHFGAVQDAQLVGVVSIYPAPFPDRPELEGTWQLRGMATAPEVRGLGIGRLLLTACDAKVRERGGTWLWCNARTPAVGFYAKHGWERIGEEFEIPTAGPHYRMLRRVD